VIGATNETGKVPLAVRSDQLDTRTPAVCQANFVLIGNRGSELWTKVTIGARLSRSAWDADEFSEHSSLVGLTKVSADTLILGGTNTYSGDTFVIAGTLALTGAGSMSASSNITVNVGATLDVSARTDGTLTLASGQVLKGHGAINGNLTAVAGSTVSPGVFVGTLTVANTATLNGTTSMELNASLHTNAVLRAAVINYGGTLRLSNVAGNLASGITVDELDPDTHEHICNGRQFQRNHFSGFERVSTVLPYRVGINQHLPIQT